MVIVARPRHVLFAALATAGCFILLSSFSSTPSVLSPSEAGVIPPEISGPNPYAYDLPHDHSQIPSTRIPGGAHSYGYSIFDNLYLRNGTFYVVTADRSRFPSLDALLAVPLDRGVGFDLTANDSHLAFIDPSRAVEILGDSPIRLDELTVVIYDSRQFITHYYHWFGEIILGFWRVYSLLGITGMDGQLASLPFPKRFFLPFVEPGRWRDPAGIDGPLMRAACPTVSIETSGLWNDFILLDQTVVFTRAALVSREAAHRHSLSGRWFKMIASTMELPVPEGFWEPLRKTVLGNFLGNVESRNSDHDAGRKPVVTYVSRQSAGRRLTTEAHEGLVDALKQLEEEGLCDVRIPVMEHMTLKEQIELASSTTIMVGVHGNGLTHQLWMPSSAQSTVIEILIPGGYVYDYEILARNMGHQHYAVWNDTALTYPKGTTHEGITYPDGFQGSEIPVHGPTVAKIIRNRLSNAA
ncbi:hypothetical protein BT96DRAFT_878635 [Gymnopus androsaceus JB14]|uniref:Glycosyltransferase 61 catalytic domain-containing protein n=1 Tax=Gymnopus androsaceus JB14 TaxID=1447944 RepID=A0A6A4I3Y9_9AGAR|nr:hypothetical protein BT96DRAFT_878635 [Gymnopus androsaceus JB14]